MRIESPPGASADTSANLAVGAGASADTSVNIGVWVNANFASAATSANIGSNFASAGTSANLASAGTSANVASWVTTNFASAGTSANLASAGTSANVASWVTTNFASAATSANIGSNFASANTSSNINAWVSTNFASAATSANIGSNFASVATSANINAWVSTNFASAATSANIGSNFASVATSANVMAAIWRGISRVYVRNEQTVSDSTPVVASGLSFSVTNANYYYFEYNLLMRSGTATAGPRVTVTIPAATQFAARAEGPVAADGVGGDLQGAITAGSDAVVFTSAPSAVSASTVFFYKVEGNLVPAADGVLSLLFANETGTTPVRIVQGSNGILWNLTSA